MAAWLLCLRGARRMPRTTTTHSSETFEELGPVQEKRVPAVDAGKQPLGYYGVLTSRELENF